MAPLITFEGGEGAGKSTQAQRFVERLRAASQSALLLHEPGGTPLGEVVYGWLRDPDSRALRRLFSRWSGTRTWLPLDPWAELFLFAAARAQLVSQVIRPALGREEVVVCDRFADSTTAYQGYGRGLPLERVAQVNAIATGGLRPALTILLDLPPEIGLARTRGQGHRMEGEGVAFHHRVRQGYLAIAREEPERFLVLDAQQPADELAERVWERVQQLLGDSSRSLP
ncbi:MAG: dTMP kinase [Chloroflexi bacterium]|nr:dTMP kinase [Chloroflexota bacterium]